MMLEGVEEDIMREGEIIDGGNNVYICIGIEGVL